MREIKALVRPQRVQDVLHALHAIADMPGVIVSTVHAYGKVANPPPGAGGFGETLMAKIETVVPEALQDVVIAAITTAAHTGHPGDGKIFVVEVASSVAIRGHL